MFLIHVATVLESLDTLVVVVVEIAVCKGFKNSLASVHENIVYYYTGTYGNRRLQVPFQPSTILSM